MAHLFVFSWLFSGMEDEKMAVLLYDTSGAQDVCINEFLVQNGYCQRAGLGYAFHNETIRQSLKCSSLFQICEVSQVKNLTSLGTAWPEKLIGNYDDWVGTMGIEPWEFLIDTLPGKLIWNPGSLIDSAYS